MRKPTFAELATAAFCPRKLHYRRREGERRVPAAVRALHDLVFRYEELLSATPGPADPLAAAPIAVTPTTYRSNLGRAKASIDAWDRLADPAETAVRLETGPVTGTVPKVLTPPIAPSIDSVGDPPERGVWGPQSVHAVAAATALADEREVPVRRAFVEYPAHGIVREVELTPERVAAYRAARRVATAAAGPLPPLADRSTCGACEYRRRCRPVPRDSRLGGEPSIDFVG